MAPRAYRPSWEADMVEHSSDITDIGTRRPKRFDTFDRVDMAIRRIPGFGVLGVMALFGLWKPSTFPFEWLFMPVTVLVLGVVALVVVEEFWPRVFGGKRFISRPPAAPSQPSV